MKTSELVQRDGVLSASANQHAVTVTCRTHKDALAFQGDLGGDVVRERLWTVRIPKKKKDG